MELKPRDAAAPDEGDTLAARLRQVSEGVRRNADAARETKGVAAHAHGATERGVEAVTLVMAHMDAVAEATKKVQEIAGIIDAIAFQTNLLAINAAIEAARAGAQGRGFAVVASEVRALSVRSAEAAREVKGLVGNAARHAREGAESVERVVEAIADINGRVNEVNRLMDAIAESGAEQSKGLDAIGAAVARARREAMR